MNTVKWQSWTSKFAALLLSFFVFALEASGNEIPVADLPLAARQTLSLIKQGGPFPYARDGAVFGNREGVLPKQKRGYYHEYTVKTPGSRTRGAKRIVTGGESAGTQEYFFTDDHYATFRRIKE